MKNQPFLRLVAEDIKSRFGTDLSEIAIVFNNKRPITYLKKHLSDVYAQAIWSPQFYTIQEFFKQSTQDEEGSALTQFFYLFELHNDLLIKEGAEPETLEEFYPIAEIILSDFGQLDYDLVNIDHIYMELYDTSRIDLEFQHFTKEQQEFLRQFWQSFSVAGHTGMQERFLRLWKRLPILYKAFKEKLKENKQTNFPTIYRDLIEEKAANPDFVNAYKKILFVGFNALNNVEATLFKKWQKEERALFYFDADAYYLDDKQQEAGLFIRRNIFQSELKNALGESPNIIGTREDKMQLYASTGKVSQTKLLHQVLQDNEQEGQSSAILLADESLLVPLLQSLPSLKVNITTGFPLTQSPIYAILDLWMNVHEEISHLKRVKVPFQYVESFINNPLARVSKDDKKEIQNLISKKQLFEIDIKDIQFKDSFCSDFFKPLASNELVIPQLIELLGKINKNINEETHIKQIDSNLVVETTKTLNQLLLGFSKIPALNIAFQIGLIRKAIASINSAIEGDPLDGLQIMGLLESRCLNFDHVYILGANEGILPKTSSSPTFLPNTLRKAYGLPVLENQDALSAYLFYRHLQYSDGLHVFYNSIVDESSTGEESRFIKQLEFESKFEIIKHTQQQPIHFPQTNDELVIHKTGEVWERMYDMFVNKRSRLSATAFTTYLQSPLQFFLKYIAQIKEPPSISQEFEMNKLGSVIHEVMERILKPYKGTGEFVATKKLLESIDLVDTLVVEEIGKAFETSYQTLDDLNSLQRIMHKISSEYVKMYLQYDADNYQAFKIIELENNEDYTLDFPIQINGKEETINLYGIIDRVDEVLTLDGEVKTRIVDYKTGSDVVKFSTIEKVFSSNTDNKALVQTLYYTYIYEQVAKVQNLEPHLYVARKMREEGTMFYGSYGALMEGEFLAEQKANFTSFLKQTLEELFNPTIPFKHNPDAHIYDSDPYTLFYRNAISPTLDEE